MPLQLEPLRRTQTALILFILFILLRTTEKTRRHRQTDGAFRLFGATAEKAIPLQVWQTCMSIPP